ncbi:MAG TPA: hypothetical protein VMR65_02150 [Candidatus Sulfotelmatobacter sp.]|jgi:hypothetical protein|nr:hypothetical protein [Candidatus Sulfotelmatobacter sp.]
MRRQGGGGLGFVMLIVVMVVVLLIALRNWKAVTPELQQIKNHNDRAAQRRDVPPEQYSPDAAAASRSSSDDSWTPSAPNRPNLDTMEQRTTAHTDATNNALQQTNN